MDNKRENKGYTLIEMMIVVVLIGIMAAWGTDMYLRHIKTSKLSAAKSALLEDGNYLENFYSKYYRYNTSPDDRGEGELASDDRPSNQENSSDSTDMGHSGKETCLWPKLPRTYVAHFKITFSEPIPPSCHTERYRLIAKPDESYRTDKRSFLKEDRYLRMDDSQNVVLCTKNDQEEGAGADKCVLFQ